MRTTDRQQITDERELGWRVQGMVANENDQPEADRIAAIVHRAMVADTLAEARRGRAGPCPCECNRGEFCGGCGHAGCGRR